MFEDDKPEIAEGDFIQKSDTQSTCVHCSEVVQVGTAVWPRAWLFEAKDLDVATDRGHPP